MKCRRYVKVGITSDVYSRLTDIQTANPDPVFLSWLSDPLSRKDAERAEKAVHANLSKWRHSGEWFATSVTNASNVARRTVDKIKKEEPVAFRNTSKHLHNVLSEVCK